MLCLLLQAVVNHSLFWFLSDPSCTSGCQGQCQLGGGLLQRCMQEKYVYPAAWCAVLGFLSFTFQPYTEGRLLSKAQWLSNDIQGFQLSPKLPSTHKTSRKASMSLWSLVTTLTKTLFVCPRPIKQHILVVSPTVESPQVLWKCRMHRGTWSA